MKNHFLHSVLDVFRIRKEERWTATALLLVLLALNAMVVAKYYAQFTPITTDAWHQFVGKFHISGFDPITYSVVTDWLAGYNVYRHPLLAFYMYPAYLLNQGLMAVTGINCALFIIAAMQVFCGFYTFVILRRSLIEIVGLRQRDASLLTWFFFSLAYVMLTTMVPDHFVISMFILVLSLYVAGRRMWSGHDFKIWQTVVYFLLTAGTSLNNGLKVFLAALFVNGRRFFRPRFLLLGVILPSALIWGSARVTYHYLVLPREKVTHALQAQKKAEKARRDSLAKAEAARADSLLLVQGDTATVRAHQAEAKKKKYRKRYKGRPMGHGEFAEWTDIGTKRWRSLVENVFGESFQLHQDYTLGDLFNQRPMFVDYRWTLNYVVEAAIVLLFIAGIWAGRRSRWLWLCLSYFGLDALLHIVLGFAIAEVYIMTAHWAYVVPFAMGFLLLALRKRRDRAVASASPARLSRWLYPTVRATVVALTLWLWVYNVVLITDYLFF